MINQFKDEFAFLSNFYPCQITVEDKVYQSSEHAYQAHKCENPEDAEMIRNLPTAWEAKKKSYKIKMRYNWDDIKVAEMVLIVYKKFKQNPDLAQQLLNTGDQELVEGNTWGDEFWGVNLHTGQGRNMLGKCLMGVRNALKY